jgi:hypothetical protein
MSSPVPASLLPQQEPFPDDLTLGEAIDRTAVARTVQNIRHTYAHAGRRCVYATMPRTPHEHDSTSYRQVGGEVLSVLGDARRELALAYRLDNADLKVEVLNLVGTVLATYTDTATGTGDGTGSITSGITTDEVRIRASIKVPSTGTAKLEFLRVLEIATSAADLP